MTTDVPTLDTSRPFTTAQARAAGISAGRLRGPDLPRRFDDAWRQHFPMR